MRRLSQKEKYELGFWKQVNARARDRDYVGLHFRRLEKFMRFSPLPDKPNAAVDVGCGPYGGMSMVYDAKNWILVDSLYSNYASA